MSDRGLNGTPRPGVGYNAGGKRTEALARRLRELKRRHAAGQDPFRGEPLPAMPLHPDQEKRR